MKKFNKKLLIVGLIPITILIGTLVFRSIRAAPPVALGTAGTYGVLAGSNVDNAGTTTVNGDLGISPGSTINDSGTLTVTGNTDLNNAAAIAAQADNATAYSAAAGEAPDAAIVGDLGGQTFNPGTYDSATTIDLNGTVTLDGGGDPNSVFIFQAGSALNVGGSSNVTLINGAQSCNVFWQVGSSATIGTSSTFRGTILALTSITATTGAVIDGRLLAQTGAVTLDGNTVTVPECGGVLHVIKTVVNDNGGTAVAADFNMHVTLAAVDVIGSPAVGVGSPGTQYILTGGNTYVVSEDANPGYAVTYSGDCDSSGNVILNSGDNFTCTVTNNDIQPTLNVIKTVVNDNGGTAVAGDFNMHVTLAAVDVLGSPAVGVGAPGTAYNLDADVYVVSEDADPGYAATYTGDCDSAGNVTLTVGDNLTCTVTNNDIQPILHVVKTVINDNSGTSVETDFNIHVTLTGVDVIGSPALGAASPGTQYNLDAETYVVNEVSDPGYVTTYSGACDAGGNVILSPGDDVTCTVTNNDVAPGTLHVIKVVTNDNGGTAVPADFNVHVTDGGLDVVGSPAVGVGAPGTPYTLDIGNYVVSEDANPLYTPTFSGDCDVTGNVVMTSGADLTCTITNNDVAPTLTVIKNVVNDNGGTSVAADFNVHVTLAAVDVIGSPAAGAGAPGTTYTLDNDTYVVSEDADAGYTPTFTGDCDAGGNVTLVSGDALTCTITNNDIAPVLHVIKVVTNDNGGTAVVGDFNLHVTDLGVDVVGSPAVGVGAPGTPYTLDAGTYVVSEDAEPNYTAAFSGACNAGGSVTLAPGDDVTCTVTNTDNPPTLTVIKTVVNDNGGTAVAADFNVHVRLGVSDVAGSPAAGAGAPGTTYQLAEDTYVVGEDANPAYAATFTGDCDAGGSVTLAFGNNFTCTITNNDIPATLHVIKTVVNDNGGTAVAADFSVRVRDGGVDVPGSPAAGTGAPGTLFSIVPGTYVVSEAPNPGYTATYSGDCDAGGNITLAPADDLTCTITNNDNQATLHIIKTVINDNSGTNVAADFNLHVTLTGVDVSGSPAAGTGAPGTLYTLNAGAYVVSEDPLAGYTGVISGDCNGTGNVTLAPGENKTCTITNNDIPPAPATLHVIKVVTNDNGGTAVAANFNLHVRLLGVDVSGSPAVGTGAPGTPYTISAGTYVVSEDANAGYTVTFSGDCNAGGSVTLAPGEDKTCTVTNNDILIVPGDLHVITTVTNDDGGTAVVGDFTIHVELTGSDVVGSPASGVGAPGTLFTLAPATYVVSANSLAGYTFTITGDCDISGSVVIAASDNLTCTVVANDVSASMPQMDLSVTANPTSLPAGGGNVAFTYTVDNTGTVPITGVVITDSGCTPVTYTSGDTNTDNILDPTETWIFNCTSAFTQTSQRNISVNGTGGSFSANDTLSLTITVGGILPNTGILDDARFLILGLALIAAGLIAYKYKLGRDTMLNLLESGGSFEDKIERKLKERIRDSD